MSHQSNHLAIDQGGAAAISGVNRGIDLEA
jgi:hypothetical protein